MQVSGKAFNNLGTPARFALPLQDVAPNPPVQQNQLAVDGKHCPDLSLVDALF